MPSLYLISGSNGAGKSTIGPDFLPPHLTGTHQIFDGDKLFMAKVAELWPYQIKSVKEAKKIATDFVYKTLDNQLDQGFIPSGRLRLRRTFPSYKTWDFPKQFKDKGIGFLCYFWA